MLKSPRLVAIAAVLLSVSGLWLIWNHLTDECLSEASRTADTILSRMRTRSIDHSLQENLDFPTTLHSSLRICIYFLNFSKNLLHFRVFLFIIECNGCTQ